MVQAMKNKEIRKPVVNNDKSGYSYFPKKYNQRLIKEDICCYHKETGSLICAVTEQTSFCIIGTLALDELITFYLDDIALKTMKKIPLRRTSV